MNNRMNDNKGSYDIDSQRRFRDGNRPSSQSPPAPGEIWEGKIQQIQPYGAFCSFGPLSGRESHGQRRVWQGLIHISQLSETRVEKVEDVVDVDDSVWVKVLEVERQDPASYNHDKYTNDGKVQHVQNRYRIKLSMKEVSQDGKGQDLGQEREAKAQITTQLKTNLNSMIGMGVAIDPMERLVLKGVNRNYSSMDNASTKTTFRGGYTLVDDDEGEPELDPDRPTAATDNTNTYRKEPMGRGRGATLPAWMTATEGPVGVSRESEKSKVARRKIGRYDETVSDNYKDHSDDDEYSRQKSSARSEEKKERKRRKKKSRHQKRRRHRSYDDHDSNSSDSSDSESSRNYDRQRRHRKRHKSSSSSSDHRRKGHQKASKTKPSRERR